MGKNQTITFLKKATKNRGRKKLNLQLCIYTTKTYRKPSEQQFPKRRPLSYPKLTKNIKPYKRFKERKNSTPNHKAIRTATEVSHWNDQNIILLGDGLKSVLQAPYRTLITTFS